MWKHRTKILQAASFKAILLALFAFACFSMADATARILRLDGYTAQQIMLFNGIFGSAYLYGLYRLLPRRGRGIFDTKKMKLHILRGVLLASTGFSIVYALQFMELTEMYVIFFLFPLLVCAFSVFLLKEDVRLVRWTAIGVGFLGALICIDPHHGLRWQPAILAVFWAAVSYALGLVMTKVIGTERNLFRMALIPVLCIIPLAVISLFFSKFSWPAQTHWMLFAFSGAMMASGIYCISTAYSMARASLIAPLGYTQLLWGGIFGYFLFADVPDFHVYIGGFFIIVSGLFIIWREHYLIESGIMAKRASQKNGKKPK